MVTVMGRAVSEEQQRWIENIRLSASSVQSGLKELDKLLNDPLPHRLSWWSSIDAQLSLISAAAEVGRTAPEKPLPEGTVFPPLEGR